jgi:hypothetical protein
VLNITAKNIIIFFSINSILINHIWANKYIERAEANYEKKISDATKEFEKLQKSEKLKVVKVFEREIAKATRKGDLRTANKLLALEEKWLEPKADEPAQKDRDKDEITFKYSLKFSSGINYTNHPKNKILIKKVLCTHKKLAKGAFIKVTGEYDITSHPKGVLNLRVSEKENPISASRDHEFSRGQGEFDVSMKILEVGELGISIYIENERGRKSGVGQVYIKIK